MTKNDKITLMITYIGMMLIFWLTCFVIAPRLDTIFECYVAIMAIAWVIGISLYQIHYKFLKN